MPDDRCTPGPHGPVSFQEDELEVSHRVDLLKAQFDAAVQLVMHEDRLNWNKLHNMVYVNLGLLAIYGLICRESILLREEMLTTISFFGLITGIGFALALHTGIGCIECHKQKVDELDAVFPPQGSDFLFYGNFNKREMLRIGPYITLLVWVVLAIAPWIFKAKRLENRLEQNPSVSIRIEAPARHFSSTHRKAGTGLQIDTGRFSQIGGFPSSEEESRTFS